MKRGNTKGTPIPKRTGITNFRNIVKSTNPFGAVLKGFLFAFWVLLPQYLSAPVEVKRVGTLIDFHQQKKDLACMNEVLYYEALNQSEEGMKAVLTVVLNRKQARGFPSTICAVVQQPGQFSYRYRTKRGVVLKPQPKNSADKVALRKIQSLSRSVVQGTFEANLNRNVLWYTRHSVQREWMAEMQVVARIDSHKFLSKK